MLLACFGQSRQIEIDHSRLFCGGRTELRLLYEYRCEHKPFVKRGRISALISSYRHRLGK